MFESMQNAFKQQTSIAALRKVSEPWHSIVDLKPPELAKIVDTELDTTTHKLPVRVYSPETDKQSQLSPALVFFHGGGVMIGSLDTHDGIARRLCARSGIKVISIDYRLAPEHPFPAGYNDAVFAFEAIFNGALKGYQIDTQNLAIGGDSAGGNFAASLAQSHRDIIKFQLLMYPVLQLNNIEKAKTRWQDVPVLSNFILNEVVNNYVKDADPTDRRISPLLCDDLSGVPPCHFIAADLDPLLEDGKLYCEKLKCHGVQVERKFYKSTSHGFLQYTRLFSSAVEALKDAGSALKSAFEPASMV